MIMIMDPPILAEPQPHPIEIELPCSNDKQQREYTLGEDVEDAVEDGFRVDLDFVAAFREAPGDGVEEPGWVSG